MTRKSRRGAVTVEFAFTVPILFLLIFASVEFSRFNMIRNAAANAAYEGCRRATVPGATAAQAQASANSILTAASISGSTVTVSPGTIATDTKIITVTVSVPTAANSWVAAAFFKDAAISRSCTLTRERTS